jgi:NTP pyrophosphatase (non-canonical NTP hydrolase)
MKNTNSLRDKVGRVVKRYGFSRDPNIILLFLTEELGEAIRAHLKETGHKEDNSMVTESFADELGDVFFLLLSLAHVSDIDLENRLENTIRKIEAKVKSHV